MADAGKLHLCIVWNGEAVTGVQIRSSRPQAFRLLQGRTPESAVQMAPLLFSLCGRAQGAAAAAATAAAQGKKVPAPAAFARSVACEAMQEHLWRLLLDWPKLLGQPPARDDFVRWHGMLREIAAGRGEMSAVLAELEQAWLGMPAQAWQALQSHDDLQAWWRACDGPAARLLAALDASDAGMERGDDIALLPPWTAQQALQACGDRLHGEFAALPQWNDAPAETGALAYYAETALLRDVLRRRPSRLLARGLARAYDVVQIACGRSVDSLDSVATEDGGGLAVVRTARGMLLHYVRLAANRVVEYLAVAPTEWNFHPRGALAAGLEGLKARDAERLRQVAGLAALSLDPCVEYGIEVSDA